MLDKIQQGWRKPGLLNYLLVPFSLLYLLLHKLRQGCYRVGIFKSFSLAVPVVVIGGISAGGSGKTPVVIALVKFLQQRGYQPGVVSRGYGGASEIQPLQVSATTSTDLVGDEPQMIFEVCKVAVVVGANRAAGGQVLVNELGCDVVVSDDGFQHFALNRDFDVVVIDGNYGFGNGFCLPAGPLREPISALERAQLILVNDDIQQGKHKLEEYAIHPMSMVLRDTYNLASGARRELSDFGGENVHAVAGVGNPVRFFSQLEAAGINLVSHAFPDHHKYTENDLEFGGDEKLLMTEKDGIKCRDMSMAKNIWVVTADVNIEESIFQKIESHIFPSSTASN